MELKKKLILLLVLVVPSVAYLVLSTGNNKFKHLPIYGPKNVDSVLVNGKYVVDTIYHKVSDFRLKDQQGREISSKDLEGKIYVADFFFTSCPSICPKITGQLQRVQEKFAAVRELRIVSFTVDPKRDSVEALSRYAKTHLVNPRKWFLLTGDKKEIYDLARNSYFATAQEGDGGSDDFIHSDQVVLIDKEKRIRGIYTGTDPAKMDTLMEDIKVLLYEYKEIAQNK